jgi:hypothetical protein
VLARLSHPNIIAYKESCLDGEGVLCIVTTFCAEGDLAGAIKRRAAAKAYFTEDEIMDVFIQVRPLGRARQQEQGSGGLGEGLAMISSSVKYGPACNTGACLGAAVWAGLHFACSSEWEYNPKIKVGCLLNPALYCPKPFAPFHAKVKITGQWDPDWLV